MCATLLTGCDSGSTNAGPEPGDTFTIELSQKELTLGVGSSVAIQAQVRDDAGRSLSGRAVFWSSSDTAIARVTSAGLVTAVRQGAAQIAATYGGRSAVANVTVAPRSVASVVITPTTPVLLVGTSTQLTARTIDALGEVLTGRVVSWSSSNAAVVSVDSTGLLTGLTAGFATVTARSEGASSSIGVTVSLVPVASVSLTPITDTIVVSQNTQLSAVPLDSAGDPLVGRPMSWSSSNTAVATVSSTGLVTGVGAGSANITATSGDKSSTAVVVVQPRPVGAVIVSPSSASIMVGQTQQLTVTVTDDNGNELANRPVQFQSGNAAVATVSVTGLVTAVAAGATSIVVTSEGRSASVALTVTPIPVASVRVEPASVDVIIGGTRKLTATTLAANGAVLTQRAVTWSSGSPSVATVANDGTVTAVGVGSAVILATSEGRTGSATVNVRSVPVGTVTVSPANNTVIIGDAVDLTAVARDGDGAVLDGRPVLWTSSDERIAAVSSVGRVVGVATGVVTITAAVDGVTGTSSVSVIREPVLRVNVQPGSATLQVGHTVQLLATAHGRNDVVLGDRVIRFTSSDATVASVSGSGLVTALKIGTATITVESEGRTTTASIVVAPVPVATVSVSLAANSVQVGQSTQATATLRDANNNVLAGRTVTWTSSNNLVATVNASGVVSGLLPGTAQITATSEGRSGSATITVTVLPVSTVSVALTPSSVAVGATSQATATVRDANNVVLTGRAVTWSTSNSNIATVDANGVVSARAQGSVSVTATSEGKSGSATLTVTPAPVAAVSVSLAPSSVAAGATAQATAVLTDANGNVLTGRAVAWSSSNTTVATVASNGVVTARTAGTASITATSEGRTGSATLTVTAGPVATVTVNLASPSVVEGATVQATAVLRDAANNVLTGRSVAWSTSNSSIATVDANGLVTTHRSGSVTITATSEGRTGSRSLSVTQAQVARVEVSPKEATVAFTGPMQNRRIQLTATAYDANGRELVGRTFNWSSSSNSRASVNSSGLVTGMNEGNATITASTGGRSGTAAITVVRSL